MLAKWTVWNRFAAFLPQPEPEQRSEDLTSIAYWVLSQVPENIAGSGIVTGTVRPSRRRRAKKLFARHVISFVPLAAYIKRILDEQTTHRAPISRFRDELEDHMAEEFAEQTLRAIIGPARYAEAFAYDENTGVMNLENPA